MGTGFCWELDYRTVDYEGWQIECDALHPQGVHGPYPPENYHPAFRSVEFLGTVDGIHRDARREENMSKRVCAQPKDNASDSERIKAEALGAR